VPNGIFDAFSRCGYSTLLEISTGGLKEGRFYEHFTDDSANYERHTISLMEKDAEITRLRKRCALLDSLLGECLRHHYYDDTEVSQTWLVEVRKAVTP
jgi:hypothetical protein